MNHINYKIGVLLHEGFSMKTLENFNNKQIDLLYEKVKGKTKEVGEQLDMVVKKDKLADPKTIEAMKKVTPGTKVTIETEVTEKALSKKQQEFFKISHNLGQFLSLLDHTVYILFCVYDNRFCFVNSYLYNKL